MVIRWKDQVEDGKKLDKWDGNGKENVCEESKEKRRCKEDWSKNNNELIIELDVS